MNRRILLLEPNYQNKYPPMGLMKLAMYHRLQKDDVVFYKGDLPVFVLSQIVYDAIVKLVKVDKEINWRKYTPEISTFIQYGQIASEPSFLKTIQRPFIMKWLEYFRKYYKTGGYYKNPSWDRVCVTTLFTFHWELTIQTIEFAKKVCKNNEQIFVGGILASVVPEKVRVMTGIKPYIGSLNITKLPGDEPPPPPFGKTIIDKLPLDYSILEEIDYKYPATDAYYAYATRGCINKCNFCAVPLLEGKMKHYIMLKKRIVDIRERFGEQRNLLLLDNNIFASNKFNEIIDEIHSLGFSKGSMFIPPNKLKIAVQQLKKCWNDRAYIRLSVKLLKTFGEKLKGDHYDRFYALLLNYNLLHDYTATKDNVLAVYEKIKNDYEKALLKKPLVRFIDFNQGIDARLATPRKMAKLATISIRPLRIAFDKWKERQCYVNTVYLAKKNNITQMSNYLLYNYDDKPEDLYHRLLLNIDLCDELDINIYSFPMKYHPIMEEEWFNNRDYLGQYWTRKSIRTVQAILNSTHGKIGKGKTFFYKAFGRNVDEFLEMIQMPEAFIIKRWDAELNKLTSDWRKAYISMNSLERNLVDSIVSKNYFNLDDWTMLPKRAKRVLEFHLVSRDDIPSVEEKMKLKGIMKFEKSCPVNSSIECLQLIKIAEERYKNI